jgi:hypothetical protein
MKSIIVRIKEHRPRPNQRRTPHNAEFGRACKSSNLIRQAFYPYLWNGCKPFRLGKLTQRLMMIQQTDTNSGWGQRTVQHGDIELLEGYDFNPERSLMSTLRLPVEASICGITGVCTVVVRRFFPYECLQYNSEPSHVRFSIAAACFDFTSGWYNSGYQTPPISLCNRKWM